MGGILVVDDERDNLEIVKQILEMAGMKAHCVTNGEEALRQIKNETFLLMVTDLKMPGMNGLELSRRALEIEPQLPIIMCTGSISSEVPRLAEEAGIAMVIGKPFHTHEFLRAVMEVMAGVRDRESINIGDSLTR